MEDQTVSTDEKIELLDRYIQGMSYQKYIILSFYKPSEMCYIKWMNADEELGSSQYSWPYYAWRKTVCSFCNVFIWGLKSFTEFNNDITVKTTENNDIPEARFSHVELSTESHTYFIKWGGQVEKLSGKTFRANNYGCVKIKLNDEEYEKICAFCEDSLLRGCKFNYVGSTVNFILPKWLRDKLFANGVYKDDNRYFCSEFVGIALSCTDIMGSADPSTISPISLFTMIMKYSAASPGRVLPSMDRLSMFVGNDGSPFNRLRYSIREV